jgi:ankyrin repeat protein
MSLNRVLRLAPVWCLALALCLFCMVPVAAQSTPTEAELSAALAAINELHLAKLRALLDKNPTLVKQREAEEDADTLLHHAVRRGILSGGSMTDQESAALVAIVKLLIERKSDVNARDKRNDTPLSYAVRWSRNIEGAKLLLANGADLNAKLPGLQGLEGSGGTALHQAVAAVDLVMVKFLIESKADVNAKDGRGNTPLITNSETGGHTEQPEIAKALIAARAAVNTQNIYGETALFKASQEGADVVRVLLANGADPNLKTKEGTSPAQAAVGSFDSRVTLQLLIKNKVALNIKDEEGRTLLHQASIMSDSNAAEILIENGSDINAKDTKGFTPLILAVSDYMLPGKLDSDPRVARGSREDVVELLLKSGANANLPDPAGNTALHYAAQENRRVILRLLLENKGDPNHKNNKGETSLHTATLYDQIAIVKLLLANKADATIKDQEGKTALDWAKQYSRDEIAALLSGK